MCVLRGFIASACMLLEEHLVKCQPPTITADVTYARDQRQCKLIFNFFFLKNWENIEAHYTHHNTHGMILCNTEVNNISLYLQYARYRRFSFIVKIRLYILFDSKK